MHSIDAPLGPVEVFARLSDQQLQSVRNSVELRRELAAATEGPGIVGSLTMRIAHELGTVDSESRSRIITAEQETLIAQLTVTALHDSPADRSRIWLTARPGPVPIPAPAGRHTAAPIRTRDDR